MPDIDLKVNLTGADAAAADVRKIADSAAAIGDTDATITVNAAGADAAAAAIGDVSTNAAAATESLTGLTAAQRDNTAATAAATGELNANVAALASEQTNAANATAGAAAANVQNNAATATSTVRTHALRTAISGLQQASRGGIAGLFGLTRAATALAATFKIGAAALMGWVGIVLAAVAAIYNFVSGLVAAAKAQREQNEALQKSQTDFAATTAATDLQRAALDKLAKSDLNKLTKEVKELSDSYKRAAADADRLFHAKQALSDAQNKTDIAKLKLEEEQSVASAPEEDRATIRAQFAVWREQLEAKEKLRKIDAELRNENEKDLNAQRQHAVASATILTAKQAKEIDLPDFDRSREKARNAQLSNIPELENVRSEDLVDKDQLALYSGDNEHDQSWRRHIRDNAKEKANAINQPRNQLNSEFSDAGGSLVSSPTALASAGDDSVVGAIGNLNKLAQSLQDRAGKIADKESVEGKALTEAFAKMQERVAASIVAMEAEIKAREARAKTEKEADDNIAAAQAEKDAALKEITNAERKSTILQEQRRGLVAQSQAEELHGETTLDHARGEQTKKRKETEEKDRLKEIDMQIPALKQGPDRWKLEAEKARLKGNYQDEENANFQQEAFSTGKKIHETFSGFTPLPKQSGEGNKAAQQRQAQETALAQQIVENSAKLADGAQGEELGTLLNSLIEFSGRVLTLREKDAQAVRQCQIAIRNLELREKNGRN